MPNPVGYFEIPVTDLDRAIAFYEALFELQLELADLDGNQMAFFPHDPAAPGISGSLAKGDSYHPGTQGSRLYFNCTDIDQTLAKAVALGGAILYPKTSIGPLGHVAEFQDPEGNCIALHSK